MANRTYLYVVEYRLYMNSDVKSIRVVAHDKWEAWEQARFYDIRAIEGQDPYNAWVHGVQYQNGKYRVIAKSESMY